MPFGGFRGDVGATLKDSTAAILLPKSRGRGGAEEVEDRQGGVDRGP